MKILRRGDSTLEVCSLQKLAVTNAVLVRDTVRAALNSSITRLDIDLSEVTFMDSAGLGTLISLRKSLDTQKGTVRLLHPAPNVCQILEITRLRQVFEIINP
ncbi:MAG TPA: STAS domain-containing protein [Candidatus Paceibacterota bacterium]|nr:STAS domain-containing protein [Verrucomicrobiota bacterium]HRY46438.1 STAS domain-containing protein [Candidatus Paceibacterota bacterium]HSA02020.1 STAS domain-containing protein [Candidatus Paceibacterota bacterium]